MNTTSRKNETLQYALLPACYWGGFCSIISFASYFLLSIGFRNTTIGVMIAVAGIFSAVLQPVVASYADRPESPSLRILVSGLIGLQLVGFLAIFLFYHGAPLVCGVIYAGEIGLQQLATPLINAIGSESLNQGRDINYGVARAMGSVGYAVIAYILGIVTVKTASVSVPAASVVILGLLLAATLCYPFQKEHRDETTVLAQGSEGLGFFLRYRRFTVVLFACILLYVSHVFLNNYTLQIVMEKGGATGEMGTAQAVASIIELPTMFLFGFLLKKKPCDFWFRMSGIFFFLKTVGTLLAPSIPVFYGVQLFQMGGWALITVSSVYYINSIMADHDKIKGQAYFTMTYTIGTVIGAILGGRLLDLYSATTMLVWGSVLSAAGGLILLLSARQTAANPSE